MQLISGPRLDGEGRSCFLPLQRGEGGGGREEGRWKEEREKEEGGGREGREGGEGGRREGGREGRGGQRKAIKIQHMNTPVYMYMYVHVCACNRRCIGYKDGREEKGTIKQRDTTKSRKGLVT